MSRIFIPEGYKSELGLKDTQIAIKKVKDFFQSQLSAELNLQRVSAPLFVDPESGLNDNLNGVERPVSFGIKEQNERQAEIVHSLAKWKRYALGRYGFKPGEGLYTDMNAIRRDEETDNVHSIYVDQWDWERIITKEERTKETLEEIVKCVYEALHVTEKYVANKYDYVKCILPEQITFVTTQELEDMYPDLTPKERENAYLRTHHTVFLMQIGGKLKSGQPHDGRAPDYDDWELNGDLIFWNRTLEQAFEVSSMGIRVSPESLDRQLTLAGCDERRELPFHKALLNGELPYTIGGGIGQSRLCMLMMGTAHIGEVQSSIWDDETSRVCAEKGILLL